MTSTLFSAVQPHPSNFGRQRNFGFQFEEIIEELNDIDESLSEEYAEDDGNDCFYELERNSLAGNFRDGVLPGQQGVAAPSFPSGNVEQVGQYFFQSSPQQCQTNQENLCSATWKCSYGELQRILSAGVEEERLNINFQDTRSYSALHYASSMGNSEITSTLLEHGSGVNVQDKNGRTPIMFAISEGNFDVVKSLIEYGADPNIQNNEGESALHLASIYGNDKIARFLLKHGATVNQYTLEGVTPLHFASASGCIDVVKTLIERGAHLNSTDEEGDTPLHWAVRESREHVVPILLGHGANVDIPNDDGETPLHLAACLGDQKMLSLLSPHSKLDATSFDMEL